MKIQTIYCRECEENTQHEIRKEVTGFERVFFGIVTLGFAEGLNDTIIECLKCGETKRR